MLLKFIFICVFTITISYNVKANPEEDDDVNLETLDTNALDSATEEAVEENISEINNTVDEQLSNAKKSINDAEKKIEKWKAWKKHLDCSSSTDLVKCTLTNLSAKGNPDSWKKDLGEGTIAATPPKGSGIKTIPYKKIDSNLAEWLKKLNANEAAETQADSSK